MSNLIATLAQTVASARIVDLSPRLERGIPKWPSHPHMVIDPTMTHEHDGYYCQSLVMAEHTGSHVDAPSHIHPQMMDKTIDRMPVTQLMGRAVVYHLGPLGLSAGEAVSREDLLRYEASAGVAATIGDIVLLDFNWAPRYWTLDRQSHWYAKNEPGLDEGATALFLERGVKAVGSDTIACDTVLKDGVEITAFGHQKYWLPNNIYIMEELVNLDELRAGVLQRPSLFVNKFGQRHN
jgi:kynurenine formamidase